MGLYGNVSADRVPAFTLQRVGMVDGEWIYRPVDAVELNPSRQFGRPCIVGPRNHTPPPYRSHWALFSWCGLHFVRSSSWVFENVHLDDTPERASEQSHSQNLIQSLNHLPDNIVRHVANPLPDPFNRQGPYLADLDPGRLRQFCFAQRQRQRKAGSRRLTRYRNGDHRAGMLVEYVCAENQHGADNRLLMSGRGIEIGPPYLTP